MTGGEGRASVVAAIVVTHVGLGYQGGGAEKVDEEDEDKEKEEGAVLRRGTSTSLSFNNPSNVL